jgi:tetratricopeptide (TPR) repeat protein
MVGRLIRIPPEAVFLLGVLLAGWAVSSTNRQLEARIVERAPDGDVGVLPDGEVLRVLSLGFERAVADLFWIRTVYYVGDENASNAKWPGAERLADLVTDVDPHFDSAYVVMASVLGALRNDTDAAIRLLEKGAAHSDYWRIHFLLGFQYFMEKNEPAIAVRHMQRALDLGGPSYLQFLVTRLYYDGGDATTAMQFIAARLRNEEHESVRADLEKRYSDLWINRDLGMIDAAIEQFRAAKSREPKSIAELVGAGLLASEPRDPKGGAYAIVEGRAKTDLEYEVMSIKVPRQRMATP